jgi:hypothetical protein
MAVPNAWKGSIEYAKLGNMDPLVSNLCLGAVTPADGRGLFKDISSLDPLGIDYFGNELSGSLTVAHLLRLSKQEENRV